MVDELQAKAQLAKNSSEAKLKTLRKSIPPSVVEDFFKYLTRSGFKTGEETGTHLESLFYYTSNPQLDPPVYLYFGPYQNQIDFKLAKQLIFVEDIIAFFRQIVDLTNYTKSHEQIHPDFKYFLDQTNEFKPHKEMTIADCRSATNSLNLSSAQIRFIAQLLHKPFLDYLNKKPKNKKGEVLIEKEEKKKEEEPKKAVVAVPEEGEDPDDDSGEVETDDKPDLREIYLTQSSYTEGFTRLTAQSLLSQLGVDFESLPPELQNELIAAARQQVASIILGLSEEEIQALQNNTSGARFKLLRSIYQSLLATPGFTHLLQACVNHTKDSKVAIKLQELKKPENFEASLKKIANDSENPFYQKFEEEFKTEGGLTPFDDQYQNKIFEQIWQILNITDKTEQKILKANFANTLDSFILQGYSPDFLALMNSGQLQLLFGDRVTKENYQLIKLLLQQFWLLRRIELINKQPGLAITLQRPLADQKLLDKTTFDQLGKNVAGFRVKYIASLGTDKTLQLLSNPNPDAYSETQEKKLVNQIRKTIWEKMSLEEKKFYIEQFLDPTQYLDKAYQKIPQNISFFEAEKAVVFFHNQIDVEFAPLDGDSLYPTQALGDPTISQPGGENRFAKQTLNTAKGVAKKLGDKAAELVGRLAIDAATGGATEAIYNIPIIGDLLGKELNQKVGKLIFAAVGVVVGAIAGLGTLLWVMLGGLKNWLGLGSSASRAAAHSGITSAKNAARDFGREIGSHLTNTSSSVSTAETSIAQNIKTGAAKFFANPASASVYGSIVVVSGATLMTLTVLQSAFLVDVPYAPVGRLSAVSQFVDLEKEVTTSCGTSCKNWDFRAGPIKATYNITITAKDNYVVTINDISDVLSVNFNKKRNAVGSIPDRTKEKNEFTNNEYLEYPIVLNPGETHNITYSEMFNQKYNHASVKNTISVEFDYQGLDTNPETGEALESGSEKASYTKYVCVGECPLTPNAVLALQILESLAGCGIKPPQQNSITTELEAWLDNFTWQNRGKNCLVRDGIDTAAVNMIEANFTTQNFHLLQCVIFARAVSGGKLEASSDYGAGIAKSYCSARDLMGATNKNDWNQLAAGDYIISGNGAYGHIAVVYEVAAGGFDITIIEADGVSGFIQKRKATLTTLQNRYCGFLRRQ